MSKTDARTDKVFLINTTKQQLVWHWRTGADRLLTFVEIPSGQQREVRLKGQPLTPADRDALIDQLRRFGARNAAEIHGDISHFSGMLFRIERPATEDDIHLGHSEVVETQEERSAQHATRAALAFDLAANTLGGQTGNRGRRERVRMARETTVEIQQQTAPGSSPSADAISFGLTVDPNAPPGQPSIPV